MSVIIKQWRLPPPSPLHLCYTMFRTLGHNYIIKKYMFRLSSLMPSSRWYKGLNFSSLYTGSTQTRPSNPSPTQGQLPIPNLGVKVKMDGAWPPRPHTPMKLKNEFSFGPSSRNHTYGSRPTCGSRQTLHADPLPRGKGKDGRSLTSNVYPTPF